jgi:hypothetical protein
MGTWKLVAPVLGVLVWAVTASAVTPEQIADKCQIDKFRAERRKVIKECLCYKKAILAADASQAPVVDAACIAAVEERFRQDIQKAEDKATKRNGECPIGGEAETLCEKANEKVIRCCLDLSVGRECR